MGRIIEKKFASLTLVLFFLPVNFFLTGCLTQGSGNEDQTEIVAEPGEVPEPPLTPPTRTICDPFSAGASAQDRGLIGNLLYLTDDQPRYDRVSDYIDNGTPIESTLYFDQLFVPTRSFDLGFYTQDGTQILNQNNDPIYEYFALRVQSQMTLAENEDDGWYQMAVLSDDGAVLKEKNSDGSLTTIIDSDGNHPTRMACASKAIFMDAAKKREIVLEYYQGPRYHISMVVLWRKLASAENPNSPDVDVQCGLQGNSMYFDFTKVPSEPTSTYYDLLTRGWKPLNNENYFFPEQANNPCASEDPLVLTNFSVSAITRTSVTMSWTTSLPSSSQGEVKNVLTGQIVQFPVNADLKTNHSITYSGLLANTLYAVKGLSASESGQMATSNESAFRTPR